MPDFDADYVHWRKRFAVPDNPDDGFCKIKEILDKNGISSDTYLNKFAKNDIKIEFKPVEFKQEQNGHAIFHTNDKVFVKVT